ncbi:hypothetical protein [Paenibacillus sp. JJ-223]|uniref:hypothetical protein n=1 Tax=Paenibacillus sp. JJ-223 TaxID=2905647 RepID=UPI001F43EB28|nr:hypothetical protein [Paenibacillus sp. JJ-223]CAH1216024.1 hypothetical protein PAECIP111890_04337 [Paenibacillus sp. JJ-223]
MKRKYIALIALVIFVVWAGSGVAIYIFVDKDFRGITGDMFGAVNALFSGFAFAGLIYTIAVQRQELSLQREAIKMQTEELKMQREETARSADQLEGQKNLLNLQMAMSVVNDLIETQSRRAVEEYTISGYNNVLTFSDMVNLRQHDIGLIKEDAPHLKSYLDTFFFILNFIQMYDLQDEQKEMLNDLVSINTSDIELKLILIAVKQSQPRMIMLEAHGFYPRYQKLIEELTMPSY